MAIGMKQTLKLSQSLVMTPQLQQAIKLLQLSRLELENLVTQEMIENPILEESPEHDEDEVHKKKMEELYDTEEFQALVQKSIEDKAQSKAIAGGKGGEGKVDDKFCVLKAEVKHFSKIKDEFFPDVPENTKKARASHTFEITEIVLPQGEKDYEKIRVLSKRAGKLIRHLEIDETENEEMKEGIEDDRERGEGLFVFLGTQSKEFVGRVDESKGNEIRTISRSGFIVKTYAIILREDKNGENNETENFEEICGHNKRVND